ncbi:MAG: hypothetical protein AAB737_03285 [Patescibacteria group bacterium]|mgnify:CR=1 FL=1
MSIHTLASHISEVRDRGLSLKDSWFARFGDLGAQPDWFELWTVVPLEHLTTDDLIWALVAAALDPEAANLVLFVFPGTCINPVQKIEDLVGELAAYGFSPYNLDWAFEESDGDHVLFLSVFSESEAYHVQDLFYPN